jgi:outer membrane protein OmpA-like peptidoglycan-associated protein
MTRLALLLGAVVVATATLPFSAPALAQSDPAAQSLIDRLRPTAGGATRGIRVPGGDPGPVASPVAPAPIWQAPPSQPRPAAAPVAPQPTPPRTTATAAAPRPPAPPQRETTADAPSVSITITFATGSATLTPEAERALAPLGRALTAAELAPYRFRVEGHTDSVGDAALNQSLSERRAAAVRDYLIRSYGVDASRLVAVGFGSSQLLVQTPPQTPEVRNRRVQIVNIGN